MYTSYHETELKERERNGGVVLLNTPLAARAFTVRCHCGLWEQTMTRQDACVLWNATHWISDASK